MTGRSGGINNDDQLPPPFLPQFLRSGRVLRSPPPVKKKPTKQKTKSVDESIHPCAVCLKTDNVDKIRCDGCNLWSHLSCVNATSSGNQEWVCRKCRVIRNVTLIDIDSESEDASTTDKSVNRSTATETQANSPPIVDNQTNLQSSVNETIVVNPQGQMPPSINEETIVNITSNPNECIAAPIDSEITSTRRNSAQSHRSRSVKSNTSNSSRGKALALQRLEEEREMQRIREQEEKKEERERQEAERRKREVRDKEYLDKKFSILNTLTDESEQSDDSLRCDGYDEGLNRTGTVQQRVVSAWLNDHQTLKATSDSNTQINLSNYQLLNPEIIDLSAKTPPGIVRSVNESPPGIVPPVSELPQVITQSSAQSNRITLPIRMQTTSQQKLQPADPNSESLGHPNAAYAHQAMSQQSNVQFNQQLNNQFGEQSNAQIHVSQPSCGQTLATTTSEPVVLPVNNQQVSYSTGSNNRQSSYQQSSSNMPPISNVYSTTSSNRRIFGTTGYGTTSSGYSTNQHNTALNINQPTSHYATFGVTNPSANSTTHQQPVSSIPITLNQQPIMSSYCSNPMAQSLPVTNQQPTMSSYCSNPMAQSLPVTNQQPSAMYNRTVPFINAPPPHQSSHLNYATFNNSAVSSGYPMNRTFNLTSATSYDPNALRLVPVNQIHPGTTSQLTYEQIASRHVTPKELPIFNGNPANWLAFFSAYNNSTNICGYNNYENLGRLQKCLKGDAETAVKSLLVHPDAVPEIMRTLFMLYGRPELIIESMIGEIQNEPAPKENDLSTVIRFALKVRNLSHTIQNTGAVEHLQNPLLINTIIDKLPSQMQLNWAYHKMSIGITDLSVLGNWLSQIAEAASLVARTTVKAKKKDGQDKKDQYSTNSSKSSSNYVVNTQVENSKKISQRSQSTAPVKKCPACCSASCTKLASCKKFNEIPRSERTSIVRANKLCTRCLGGHHFFRCRSNLLCKEGNCKGKHHTLLHNTEKSREPSSTNSIDNRTNTGNNSSEKFSANASHSNVTLSIKNERTDIFRIVPIIVFHKNRSIQVYAYLDDGSNMTTIEIGLANELNITGTSKPLCVDWAFGQTHSSVESKIVSIRVSGCFDNAQQYNLDNVRTVKELHLPTQSLSQSWINQFSHLKGLPISTYESAKPRVILGLQHSRLMVSLNTIEGGENEPIACKTRLGWVVQGPSYGYDDETIKRYSMNMCECQASDIQLHQLVKEYFCTENLGVKVPEKMLESKEIQRARQIMETTTSKSDGRYETGLLWKFDRFELPDSYPMALKRLRCLESKMVREPKLAANLRVQIQQFLEKGYIRKLEPDDITAPRDTPVWYLPTFPAFNPKKPDKVRIVWDGAATVANTSLNSMLLTGPDQLVPLPDILRRFRERLYATMGDIKEMFHQIKVIKVDQNAQRFLWRDGDPTRKPDVYVMLVVSFGLKCSPSQAQFVKNKNALEFRNEYPEAVNTIINNHYVDDMLDSEHTLEAAKKRINDVKFIHQKGGFEIRNFVSNSKELLRRIGENVDQPNQDMNISVEPGTERVLGMFWNTSTDCFTFSLQFTKINEKILSGNVRPTKREVLRTLMSVFDPLGLLANYLIFTKILLQEIWRSNISWDEPVTTPVFNKWMAWIRKLPNVETIQIPRLYSTKLSPNPPKSIQLHIFVDASAEAYATAIYLRIKDDDGVDCCLIGAKTKVAPNKPMTIPRLELQGAVIGTRLANTIKSSQTFKIEKETFWCDSQTVMGWINSEARRYNQFVAFRIGEILETSDQKSWRWIPSEHNVADEATKSKEIAKLDSESRWYKGPKFLYDKEENWFNDEGDIEFFTEEEMKPSFTMACREIVRPQLIDIERFSNWNRLVRTQAYSIRFIRNVRRKHPDRQYGPLSKQEIENAENHLYRRAQMDCFIDEILIMKRNQNVSSEKHRQFDKSSALRTNSPYLDEHEVIRMKGRLDAANVVFDAKRPIILPKKHRITKLIVDWYHRKYKHINHSTAINGINQKFAIPSLRVVMKGIRSSCQKCKNLLAEPKIPEMAELPPARLATHTLPFTFVGLDYFGPIRVKNGRITRNRPVVMEKRWILLFTCLTTRAIWMEISHSLDTGSCLMSIENFICRNGQPQEIHSDNGSSFHSSEKELCDEFKKMNPNEIEENMNNVGIVWKFNPPTTPHMGGVWERLIRTVKSCLKQTMLTRCPNDEMLKNLIVEAENIVNSRPLTYVSLESADQEALTPNHILLGSSNGRKPLAEYTDKDLARNTYKAVQVLANNFWHRFVLEYMPTLTKRTKWFQPVEPIKVGDVVIVVDEQNDRNTWPKGIVEELLPDKKGIVRQVMVRTVKGIRRRSVGKLAVLDVKPPKSDEVKQTPLDAVNGEGNVGQHWLDGNADLIQPDRN